MDENLVEINPRRKTINKLIAYLIHLIHRWRAIIRCQNGLLLDPQIGSKLHIGGSGGNDFTYISGDYIRFRVRPITVSIIHWHRCRIIVRLFLQRLRCICIISVRRQIAFARLYGRLLRPEESDGLEHINEFRIVLGGHLAEIVLRAQVLPHLGLHETRKITQSANVNGPTRLRTVPFQIAIQRPHHAHSILRRTSAGLFFWTAPMSLTVHQALAALTLVPWLAHVHAKVLRPFVAIHLQALVAKDAQLLEDFLPIPAKRAALQHLLRGQLTQVGGNVRGQTAQVVALCVRMLGSVVEEHVLDVRRPTDQAVLAQRVAPVVDVSVGVLWYDKMRVRAN